MEQSDLDDLLEICKGEKEGKPIAADHIRDPAASNVEVSLSKLHNLEHVNALQPGKSLSFNKTGLTVIYGDNGAGKSGYARVLKQACRARLPKDDIVLPNIYAAQRGIPQAEVGFRIGGQNQSVAWKQGAAADARLATKQTGNVRFVRFRNSYARHGSEPSKTRYRRLSRDWPRRCRPMG